MIQQEDVRTGKYRHFKGGLYEVIGVATNVETQEKLVVYRPLYGNQALVARPKSMFLENVEVNGRAVPRFSYVDGFPSALADS